MGSQNPIRGRLSVSMHCNHISRPANSIAKHLTHHTTHPPAHALTCRTNRMEPLPEPGTWLPPEEHLQIGQELCQCWPKQHATRPYQDSARAVTASSVWEVLLISLPVKIILGAEEMLQRLRAFAALIKYKLGSLQMSVTPAPEKLMPLMPMDLAFNGTYRYTHII